MLRYLITTHSGYDGARLSKLGHWGNIPHADDAAAEAAARADAGKASLTIERKHIRRRRHAPQAL